MNKFTDYKHNEIFLDDTVWQDHIRTNHPEITFTIIQKVLNEPTLVCRSQHENMADIILYYDGPFINSNNKERFYRVVVKECNDGLWISTAHLRSKISGGEILYKAGEK